jgi:hypothetical protein
VNRIDNDHRSVIFCEKNPWKEFDPAAGIALIKL